MSEDIASEESLGNLQSRFFEFLKRRTLLEKNFCIALGRGYYLPLFEIPEAINSLLLVDLMGVWEEIIKYIFKLNNLIYISNGKQRMQQLTDLGLIEQPKYIAWYTDMRNDIAHRNARIDYSHLNQALNDIKNQLILWEIFWDYNITGYVENLENGIFNTGVRMDDIKILEYHAAFTKGENSNGVGWSKIIDLQYDEFKKLSGKA